MQKKYFQILLLATIALGACKAQQSAEVPATVSQPAASNDAVIDNSARESAVIATPLPTTVLHDIYKEEIQDAEPIQLKDGRYVSYWYGHQFAMGGKTYFVGFSEATAASEIEYPAYENKVSISQATYELLDGKWKLNNTQNAVGSFGSFNKPPTPENEKKADSFASKNGKLFIAIPTFKTATAGVRLSALELFAVTENAAGWQYLGQIEAGSDNSAGCAEDAESSSPIQCAASTASLKFTDSENQAWPGLRVQMQGTTVSDDGKVTALSDKDFIEYHFDQKSSVYKK